MSAVEDDDEAATHHMASADDRVVLHLARSYDDRWRALDVGQALARIKSGALARRSTATGRKHSPRWTELNLTGRSLLRLPALAPSIAAYQATASSELAPPWPLEKLARVCFPRRRQN